MKQSIFTILSCILVCFGMEAQEQQFSMTLTGNAQPLPVLSMATGTISATLTGDTLAISGEFGNVVSGVDTAIAGGVHLHTGLAGQNGGVLYALQPTLSEGLNGGMFEVASNTFVLDSEAKAALLDRKLYINIHSNDYAAGEIRGQMLPNSDAIYQANLFGSNQIPSVMSDGQGTIMLELAGNQAVLSGSISNLSSAIATDIAGGAHLHLGLAGSEGPVLIPINLTLSADSTSAEILQSDNTFMLEDEDIAALQSEGVYVNVHTQNWPSGEVRGQMSLVAQAKMRTHLSGANHIPATNSFGNGELLFGLRDGMLSVSGSFSGLESELNSQILGGAHIHLGMAGRSGDVAFPLTVDLGDDNRSGTLDPAKNSFAVTGDTLMALIGRALYVNVHSIDLPGGELRGQIVPESQYFLNADLSGAQETHQVDSDGSGKVIVEVLGGQITVTGSFADLGSALATDIANGAHIHAAPAGSDGPVLAPLVPTADEVGSGRWRAADNKFTITATRKDSLRSRLGYINVHSTDITMGELRGQLLHEATAYFYAPLSGAEEVPAVNTMATGAALLEYNGSAAIISGSFSELGSPVNTQIAGGAHIHDGVVGSNGGLVIPLDLDLSADGLAGRFEAVKNTYTVSEAHMDSLRNRMRYINIHTMNVGSGELRGNFRPLSRAYYLSNLRGKNTVPAAPSTGVGAMLFERNGNDLVASGSFANLSGDFDLSIAGGAHLHFGMAGMEGGIALFLNSEASPDLKGATFYADSNSWELADSTLMMLKAGNTYVNIHSTSVPAGEIRGQALLERNYAPTAVAITAPMSGDTVSIGADLTETFTASWDASRDENGNKVVYVWQLATNLDFSSPALTVNTGEATQFNTTFGTIDTLLALLGIDTGQSLTVYHRVVASDGSLCGSSTVDSVVLVRGMSTSLVENPYLDEVFHLFPNPTPGTLQMEMVLKQKTSGLVILTDLVGRTIMHNPVQLFEGSNLLRYDVQAIPAGTYLMRLILNDEVSVARPFLKN